MACAMADAAGSSPALALRALLFCVFDREEGPIVCCSDPPDAVGVQFKPLGRYLLPESFVKGRVVSVVLDDNVVLGAPVYIEDTLYPRNCFQFNICSVISSHIDVEPYRDLAQHLASAFHALEVEIKLLSGSSNVQRVQGLLAGLRRQLRQRGECFVRVDEAHCISFRVWHCSPVLPEAPLLGDVPVPLVDLQEVLSDTGFPFEPDLTLRRVAGHLDGARSVEEVIRESSLQQDHVLVCLRHLVHFGLVAVIDAITLSSRYWLTPEFHVAFERTEVALEAVRYVTMGAREADVKLVQVVQGLYAGIDGWRQTLGEFQQANAAELQEHDISLRHFITFGLLQGFLERIDSSNQGLTEEEAEELEALRSETIPRRKQELKEKGMSIVEVNKHEQVRKLVARMNELKAKEKYRPASAHSIGSGSVTGDSGSELRFQSGRD